jgi:hypothetical protein
MATYKLIQDIEAEDHILGPLTLRQFIFALIGIFCWYLSFIAFTKHAYFGLIVTVPPALFLTFFAIPFGRDQPTEVWALAKLRFWFKPRRRIWDQSGIKELVTITVPKKVERVLTKGFSQNEVHSRLSALATTLDSRGWAIKNVNLNAYSPPNPLQQNPSDRLVAIGQAPQEVPNYDVQASDDILDETSNPVAQQFQSMITQSSKQHRQHLIDEMNDIRTGQAAAPQSQSSNNGWFMNRSVTAAPAAASGPQLPAPTVPIQSMKSGRPSANANLRTLQPHGNDNGQGIAASAPRVTSDASILSLANNNDLNVSTLARQASSAARAQTTTSIAPGGADSDAAILPLASNDLNASTKDDDAQDEVVVSLR